MLLFLSSFNNVLDGKLISIFILSKTIDFSNILIASLIYLLISKGVCVTVNNRRNRRKDGI